MFSKLVRNNAILQVGRRSFSAVATAVTDSTCLLTTSGTLPVTTKLHIVNPLEGEKIPVFRILAPDGKIMEGAEEPKISEDLATKMYQHMVRIQQLDDILYNAQRQGRISFYMQANGEEAIHIGNCFLSSLPEVCLIYDCSLLSLFSLGTASALDAKDMVFAQYREQGVLLWRGFSLQQAADQCFSNEDDAGKGRQMPVHYGSKALHYQTISSPLATQIPQAVGAAYAYKLQNAANLPICFFGEGAASEGDFHAALNFASTLETPIIFFCRNNGYAISTPTKDQFRGDGIASRAAGYGMHVIRVDGNDLFAVRKVVEEARKLALEKSVPVLIEAMSYRQGHHSTSDDSTRYRSPAEIKHWQDNYDPVARFRTYMENKGWWNEEQDKLLREKERAAVLQAMEAAEKKGKPSLDQMFDDVYETKTAGLKKQEQELLEHIAKYPEQYKDNHH
jgi:2-oxoisovalerate dehydrogenase E1 component alpha subunit